MKKITIYVFDNAIASTITGPMDIFSSTGIMWNFLMNQDINPRFMVELASKDGGPVRCYNNLEITPHTSIGEVGETDLILVPAVADDIPSALAANPELLPWLAELHQKGAALASVCTGAFFLAQAGLLDGKTATTHWAYARLFEESFPRVKLDTRSLITRDGNIICAAGSSSWSELGLYLVQAFCGKQTAVECSKILLLDMSRSSQVPYGVLTMPNNHKDAEIHQVQDWLQAHYQKKFSLADLSRQFNMSERTLKRRFKKATGTSPLTCLQMVRMEAAKGLLEQSDLTVETIAHKTGYEDQSFFRKLFKRNTGLSPNQYRKSFSTLLRGE